MDYPKTITLPSGKTATLTRKVKVRDVVFARRVVDKAEADNSMAITLAAMAPTIEIDGKSMFYEDLLDLDMEDATALNEVTNTAAAK